MLVVCAAPVLVMDLSGHEHGPIAYVPNSCNASRFF